MATKDIGKVVGEDGYSPSLSVDSITGGHRVTLTNKAGSSTFDVMDGEDADPTELIDDTAGAGDTGKTFSADKLAGEFSAVMSALNDKYEKPSGGIPGTDLADSYIKEPSSDGTSGQVLTTDGQGGRSWTTPSGGGSVSDVQIDGTSILSSGVANIPVGNNTWGVVKVLSTGQDGVIIRNGKLGVCRASDAQTKAGVQNYQPVTSDIQHLATFYGLAKAAGSDMSGSNNSVGTYTESAKSAISQMLDAPETVSGSTPSITAKAGVRYICGECSTLTIVVPASGIIDVVFESGSTATVLTVTPPSGVTAVKWVGDFDPTSLEANTKYEINIMDGEWGMAVSWT